MGTSAWTVSDSAAPTDNGGWTISDSPRPSKSKFSSTAQINYAHPAGLTGNLPPVPGVAKQLPKGPSLFKQLETPPNNIFTRAAEGNTALTKTDTNPNENPVVRGLSNIGAGAVQAAAAIPAALTDVPGTIIRTGEGVGHLVNDLENPYQAVPQVAEAAHTFAQHPVENLEKGAGQAAGAFITGELPGAIAEKAAPIAEKTATGLMNKTVGSRFSDFARGANPGRGYIRAGGGPAMSMEGLADRAEVASNRVGQGLQQAYGNATSSGVKIPVQSIRNAVDGVIDAAKKSASGAGVLTDPETYENLRQTFEPAFQQAEQNGGFTPNELWEIRKNIDRNLNWADQSKLNMTKVQQQTSGAIGGVLEDAVPETKNLNQTYQDLSKFRKRAAQRAASGSQPLSHLTRKVLEGAGGAAIGAATGHPVAGILTGLGAEALDSVPARSLAATGLNAAGKLAGASAPGLSEVALPATLGAVAGNEIPRNNGNPNESDNQNNGQQHAAPPTVPSSIAQTPESVPSQTVPLPGEYVNRGGIVTSGKPDLLSPAAHPTVREPAPETHVFSISSWKDANPDGDVSAAIQEAKRQGYDIED